MEDSAPGIRDLFERRQFTLIGGPEEHSSEERISRLVEQLLELVHARGISLILQAPTAMLQDETIDASLALFSSIREHYKIPVLGETQSLSQAIRALQVLDAVSLPLEAYTQAATASLPIEHPLIVRRSPKALTAEQIRQIRAIHGRPSAGLALQEFLDPKGPHLSVHTLDWASADLDIPLIQGLYSSQAWAENPHPEPRLIRALARAATAVGIDGMTCSVASGPNRPGISLEVLDEILDEVTAIDAARRAVAHYKEVSL